MKEVYVYQVGNSECFKIGKTTTSGADRKKNVATGSPEKLTQVRSVPTNDHNTLEKYIHMLLDHYRAPNGEFFYCDLDQIDNAIESGIQYVNVNLEKVKEAASFKDIEPTEVMIDATESILEIHKKLFVAKQKEFFIKKEIENLEAELKNNIQGNLGITGVATWKLTTRTIVDQKTLKENYPLIFEECSKASTCRQLKLIRG
tara:strand:+ start:157 stop:762 length:606 start_codon:yes stop_codon:yes gene_type:complete